MTSGGKQAVTLREASRLTGKSVSTIRKWFSSGQVAGEKRGREIYVFVSSLENRARDSSPKGRKPGRPKQPRVADEEMPLAEFAARAGLSERTVRRYRSQGRISRYTETELLRVLGEGAETNRLDPATASDDDLRDASEAEIKRVKLYYDARLAMLKAAREESKVYDAAAVEGVVRRLAHLARTAWQQAPMLLPQELAGKDAADIRAILARYAQQQIEALANVADLDLE